MYCNVMNIMGALKIYKQIHEDAHVLAALNIGPVLSFLIGAYPNKTLYCAINSLQFQAPELLSEKNAQGKTPLDCAKYEKKRQQAAYLASLPY